MGNGFRIGRIAGVHVYLDWSLLIIFFLITFSLAVGVFPLWHPEWRPATAWLTAMAAAVLFFASVLVHELSHAVVGRAFGVEIQRITLFIFGGMAHVEREPGAWKAELAMAIAGPITSLILGVGFLLLGSLTSPVAADTAYAADVMASLGPVPTLLFWLGPVNIILALFNLVPGFPLDGGRVLRAILWGITGSLHKATRWAARLGQMFAWFLIIAGIMMMLGIPLPFLGAGLLSGLWLAFIGWFLNNAALMSYRQLLVREALEHTPVARVMRTEFDVVPPDMPVSILVDDYLMRRNTRAFPVLEGPQLQGLTCLSDIRRVNRADWDHTRVGDIMTPVERLTLVAPTDDAADALFLLTGRGVNQLPVVEDGSLRGMLQREDLLKWLTLYGDPGSLPAERPSAP